MASLDIILDREQIVATVERVAGEIRDRYDDGLVLIGVLRGSVPFVADLSRAIGLDLEIDFVAVTPYTPGTGRVRLMMDAGLNLEGRDVLIVEDIVDTGLTSAFLLAELRRRSPRSVALCTLVDRPVRRVVPVDIAFTGVTVEDQFVLGYGLDYEGRYRNVGLLAAGDLDELNADADTYVQALYGA